MFFVMLMCVEFKFVFLEIIFDDFGVVVIMWLELVVLLEGRFGSVCFFFVFVGVDIVYSINKKSVKYKISNFYYRII